MVLVSWRDVFSVLLPWVQQSVWFKHEYVKDRAHAVWWSHKPCQQCLRMHSEARRHRSARQKAVCSFLPFVYNAAIRDLMYSIWEGSSGTCDSTAQDTGREFTLVYTAQFAAMDTICEWKYAITVAVEEPVCACCPSVCEGKVLERLSPSQALKQAGECKMWRRWGKKHFPFRCLNQKHQNQAAGSDLTVHQASFTLCFISRCQNTAIYGST